MKRLILLTLMSLSMANVLPAGRQIHDQQPQYTKDDSTRVCQLLSEAGAMSHDTNFMLHFARKLTGLPYVGQTLERNKTERLVVNLRELDCTTYIENVTALALCAMNNRPSFNDFCYYLQLLRYRDGIVSYTHRLHYFTEWIIDNTDKKLVEEVNHQKLFTGRQTISVGFMSHNPDKYPMLRAHPEWVGNIADTERYLNGRTCKFIPKSQVTNDKLLRETIHDGDIIAIVTNRKGLDISHVGIAAWHKDGLHLLNASSIHKKTVEEPMTMKTYMDKHPSQSGIRVIRVL